MNPAPVRTRLDALESVLGPLERELLELQQGTLETSTKSSAVDFVTEADLLAEKWLVCFIRERFPDDSILSEEGTDHAAGKRAGEGFEWILDPIDGTTNFANRMPIWAISAGLRRSGRLVGGLVSGPGLGLRYRAIRGEGASCNGRPIRVNDKTSLAEGLVVTGFPYDRAKRAAPLSRAVEAVLPKVGGLRRLGAAALDFCFLADGRMSGYYEMGLKPWDFAAGSLIAGEAGAVLTDFEGAPLDIFTSRGVVAANPQLHPALLALVAAPMREAAGIDAS